MTVHLKKKALEELIARKNMSHDDVARMLGISRAYLSMLKIPGKYNFSPSPDLRGKLMRFFNASFDDLFFIPNARFSKHNDKSKVILPSKHEVVK